MELEGALILPQGSFKYLLYVWIGSVGCSGKQSANATVYAEVFTFILCQGVPLVHTIS